MHVEEWLALFAVSAHRVVHAVIAYTAAGPVRQRIHGLIKMATCGMVITVAACKNKRFEDVNISFLHFNVRKPKMRSRNKLHLQLDLSIRPPLIRR